MATPAVAIDRPLRLGELLSTAIRIYSGRGWAFAALGLLQAGTFVAAAVLPVLAAVALASLGFAAALAATSRLVLGDPFGEALRRTVAAAPILVVLALVVGVPFYLSSAWLELLVFAVGWLGLTAFAIPAAMVEGSAASGRLGRLAGPLRRTLTLARAGYWHAVGVVAALVVIYLLVGVALAAALFSFADNGRLAAVALSQVVLAPFFFIGLTVLYFEQGARAVESVSPPAARG